MKLWTWLKSLVGIKELEPVGIVTVETMQALHAATKNRMVSVREVEKWCDEIDRGIKKACEDGDEVYSMWSAPQRGVHREYADRPKKDSLLFDTLEEIYKGRGFKVSRNTTTVGRDWIRISWEKEKK